MTNPPNTEAEARKRLSELSPRASLLAGLSMLRGAILEGDPKAELELRVRDLMAEVRALPLTETPQ